jgi:hypothetical protein
MMRINSSETISRSFHVIHGPTADVGDLLGALEVGLALRSVASERWCSAMSRPTTLPRSSRYSAAMHRTEIMHGAVFQLQRIVVNESLSQGLLTHFTGGSAR